MERVFDYELQIFNNLLSSICEQMGNLMQRSSISINIKDRKDFSCALFDSRGNMISQASHIPVHIGSMSHNVKSIIKDFNIKRGNIFISNDPFNGGTHLPDITCVAPFFYKNNLELFLATRGHHSDIGGISPGSMPISKNIHEEGLLIKTSLIKKTLDDELIKQIAKSSRTPDERYADLQAQIATLDFANKKLGEIYKKYGAPKMRGSIQAIKKYTRRFFAEILRVLPEGEYSFSDFLENDGIENKEHEIRLKIIIQKDGIILDFGGTSERAKGPINCPKSVVYSAVLYCFQCLIQENIPKNEELLRFLKIKIPKNCILNAKFPDAVAAGNVETSQRIVDTIFGALSKAIPNKIPAASGGSMNNISIGDTRNSFAYYETIGSGAGAGRGYNGEDGIQTHMTNTLSTPVEVIENELPIRITDYSIRQKKRSKSAYKGGSGIKRTYNFREDVIATLITERRVIEPYGLRSGSKGQLGRNFLIKRNGNKINLPSKTTIKCKKGESIEINSPGGGSWGLEKK